METEGRMEEPAAAVVPSPPLPAPRKVVLGQQLGQRQVEAKL